MRSSVLSGITTALTTLTQFSVSQELPWAQNGDALYLKNKKKVYVDNEFYEQTTLIPVFNGDNVVDNGYVCRAYLSCDAKNPPSQLGQAITNILTAKSSLYLNNTLDESDYSYETTEDTLIYTFEFRQKITTT